jgi:dienelactone hydrolase
MKTWFTQLGVSLRSAETLVVTFCVTLPALMILSGSVLAAEPNKSEFEAWKAETRQQLRAALGIPSQQVPLAAEKRGQFEHDGIVIEKWIFTSEPGSRVPAVLYRPKSSAQPMPAIVFTYGHGCSKSQWAYHYAGLLYAKLGLASLAIDPMGEEERNVQGRMGTREHDIAALDERAAAANRIIMGKLVYDTMRSIDFLLERDDIDSQRIGIVGFSLGGTKASWMAALDPRIKLAIVAGWCYGDAALPTKLCSKVPTERMLKLCTWPQFATLAAPSCALLVMNGDADVIIDRTGDGSAWRQTSATINEAAATYQRLGVAEKIENWMEPQAGHRPFFIYKRAIEWIHQYLGTPGWSLEQIQALPTINSGQWCDLHGVQLEKLYSSELHYRGATLVDLKLIPVSRETLACLRPNELGTPEFTLEGWLTTIEANNPRKN